MVGDRQIDRQIDRMWQKVTVSLAEGQKGVHCSTPATFLKCDICQNKTGRKKKNTCILSAQFLPVPCSFLDTGGFLTLHDRRLECSVQIRDKIMPFPICKGGMPVSDNPLVPGFLSVLIFSLRIIVFWTLHMLCKPCQQILLWMKL